jgi:crotonobetainyl-CoA:carnitine CoA-transferase CaiB-like acyl-CoA transferase
MQPGPLDGVKVLDLSRLVAGNQLTMLLGDFGAEVIKIESPAGDTLRQWLTHEMDLDWKVYGRNKQSVELNLKEKDDRDRLLALVSTAHVLVESFRPGVLEEMGLAPAELHVRNPALVIARISGWGQTGAFANKPGFGTLVEAMSGFAAANGFSDREPVLPPIALADMLAGIYGAFGVVLAVRYAESTGVGQVVDISLFESLFSTLGPTAAAYRLFGDVLRRNGSRATSAPRNVYRTKDGEWLALSAPTQSMTDRLFRAIQREDLIGDPRFLSNTERVRNVEALDLILGDYFGEHEVDDALRELEAAGVTVSPVCDVGQLLDGEFFRSREVVIEVEDACGSRILMHNVVPRLSASPGHVYLPAPRLGEHTEKILRSLVDRSTDDAMDEISGS